MIKCRIALSEPQECGKDICCHVCEDKETCRFCCEEVINGEDPDKCEERIEEPDELQIMENAVPDKIQQVTDLILQVKKAEAQIEKIKESLLKAMEQNGIKKFENEQISFTYVAPTTRQTFDKKALEKDHPELDLSKYNKTSDVKSSVRIKVK